MTHRTMSERPYHRATSCSHLMTCVGDQRNWLRSGVGHFIWSGMSHGCPWRSTTCVWLDRNLYQLLLEPDRDQYGGLHVEVQRVISVNLKIN